MVYKIIARRNGDWVFLVFQLFLTCIMAAMVYMAALCHGSTRLGILVALAVVSLWWLIDEGFMVKYISTLPSDDKAPVKNEVSAKESWRKLCKKYDVLDDEQKSVEDKGEEDVVGKAKKASAAVAKKEEKGKKGFVEVAKKEEKVKEDSAAVVKKVAKKVAKKHSRLIAKQEKRAKKSAKTATKKSASVEKSASDSDSADPQDISDAQGASTSAFQGIIDNQDVTPSDESASQDNSPAYTVSEFRDYFNRFRDEKDSQDYFERLQDEVKDAEDLQDVDGESTDDSTMSDPQGISDEKDSVTYDDTDSLDNSSTHTVSEFRDYFNRFQEGKYKED